jgi:RND family efflux transporter MFP subunit
LHRQPATKTEVGGKKRAAIIGSIIGLAVILLGGLFFIAWKKELSPRPEVTLYQVGRIQSVPLTIGGGGIAFPKQQVIVTYPASERVTSVMVKAGDLVKANQQLVKIDTSQQDAAIQQAQSDMQAALNYLYSVSSVGTANNIAQAQQSYQIARDRYNAVVAQASSPMYHNGTLISPMSGVVTRVNVDAGEVTTANTPLLTIMDESTEIVHIDVPLAELGQLHLGQKAQVTPAALADLSLPGTVSNIIPRADPQTDTFEVWVSVNNPKDLLLPGMSAFARIETTTKALSVPRLAVLDTSGDATVYVARAGVAHLQSVQVVGRSADTIYIGGGIQPGDQIILVGIDGVQDGQNVKITGVEGP